MKLLKSVERDAFTGPVRTPTPKPKIERGVPIPPSRLLVDRLPLLDLEPGDSFEIPEGVNSKNIYHLAKRLKITIEIHEGRCWRVK